MSEGTYSNSTVSLFAYQFLYVDVIFFNSSHTKELQYLN